MKELVAFIFLIVLIGVGWNQPYKAHFSSVAGNPPPVIVVPAAPAPVAPPTPAVAAAPAPVEAPPARDGSWLWKKGALDAPDKEASKPGGGKHGR